MPVALARSAILPAMAEENVEPVRDDYERWSAGDFRAAPALPRVVVPGERVIRLECFRERGKRSQQPGRARRRCQERD